MSWFAGNVRPTSLLTSEAVPLLDAQGARFQTTRLAMMRGSDRACADYQTPTASSCAVQRREIDPFGRGLGGSLRRLPAGCDPFDDLRRKERQPHQSSDVVRIAFFALSNFRNSRRSPGQHPRNGFQKCQIQLVEHVSHYPRRSNASLRHAD
jgi:hypothetical protein